MATLYRSNGEQQTIEQKRFSLKDLRSFVGGNIERIALVDDRVMYLNEDGKSLGLPPNQFATFLGDLAGIAQDDVVVGDVIVLTLEEEQASNDIEAGF